MHIAARPDPAAGVRLADVAALLGVPVPPVPAVEGVEAVPAVEAADGPRGPLLRGVSLDSRRVAPGDLYAALPGAHTHGARHVATAAAGGAAAVLTDPAGADLLAGATGHLALPVLVVPDPRAALGAVSSLVHGAPAEHLTLIGVTGTNGKTTVTTLLEQALTALGRRTGLVGTICSKIAGTVTSSARTTPEAPELHALLASMVAQDVDVAALEVSSHALALHRVDGVTFDVAAFTNLSQDHLDFHAGMQDYFDAKADLFTPRRCRRAVVCVDDTWGAAMARRSRAAGVPTTTLSVGTRGGDWSVDAGDIRSRRDGGPGEEFVLHGPHGSATPAASPLPGRFNTANTALALVILDAVGVALPAAAAALAGAPGVPGRMQVVSSPRAGQGPRAIVDYAHTPDAVAAALAALRPDTPGDLVVVLGAGGDRDRAKRSAMGRAAAGGADVVVVTDDNPRSEDPAAIRAAVLAGAAGPARVLEVAGRADAIDAGVALAARRPGGTLLVAGKGHERGQEIAGVVHDFDDVSVLRAALDALAVVGSAP